MKITADLNAGKLFIQDAVFPVSCQVRTLKNGTRKSFEIVRSIPNNVPYDPQPFPKGIWRITAVEWNKDNKKFDCNTYGPVKIRTDAWQLVNIWELDNEGDYLWETDQRVRDTGYLLHYTVFNTTLGCIKIERVKDAFTIGSILEEALKTEEVFLEVF
jgi:hypothetical protein